MSDRKFSVTSKEALAFFFRAMSCAWPAGGKYTLNLPFPGFQTFWFEEDQDTWRLIDTYHTTPDSTHSSGMTLIYWKDIPVWVMHYGGWYEKVATSLLKEALLYNYSRGKFFGGRGPSRFPSRGGLLYVNDPTKGGENFESFEGGEFVYDTTTEEEIGTHWYCGEWLIEV